MNHEDLVDYCMAKLGATPDEPWGGRDADKAGELRNRYPDTVTMSHYIGRYGWNRGVSS